MKIPLNNKLIAKCKKDAHNNVIGRYSVSKIWAINNGYLTPEQYIKGEEITPKGARRMLLGKAKHKLLEQLFPDHQTEIKKERKVWDFEIVGIADILDLEGENVCDFKTSEGLKIAKPWDEYQVKIYCTMFEKPKGLILQPRFNENDTWLELIGEVKRDDKWFNGEMKKLGDFHDKLTKL